MEGNIILAFLIFWPMAGAVISYLIGRRSKKLRDYFAAFVAAFQLVVMLYLVFVFSASQPLVLLIHNFCIQGLSFKLDGFRLIYGMVTALMWAGATFFSREYFKRYRNRNRYYFFLLITLGATMGVFLSADLFTTFLFFEMLSFTSYVWVAHDENPQSLRAAATYLGVAVIGGLVMLMGLFVLYHTIGTLEMDRLFEAGRKVWDTDYRKIYAAGGCMLFGFGAKAGMFPLHIWLPKAHPVAPAPASALLSGILTKTGVFGILVISCNLFLHNAVWGELILVLGVITMVGGAVLALFSIDIKRILACSSMSQIGFILVGIGMQGLLGMENALAVRGTLLHMVNHSLFKLVLFIAAGVIFMNIHALDLNEIRGFGRNKHFLKLTFLMGALGIGGIPLFSGYVSKTLLHESIVEYTQLLLIEGVQTSFMQWVEVLFLITGGLTIAYMAKIFVAVFIEIHPTEQKKMDSIKRYISGQSMAAIVIPALIIPVLGLLPSVLMDGIAQIGQDFMQGISPVHKIHYFSLGNLKGSIISIVLGIIIYLGIVRVFLMRKNEEHIKCYIDLWPRKLDLENVLYRPVLLTLLPGLLGVVFRFFDHMADGFILFMRKTVHRNVTGYKKKYVGTRFTDAMGIFFDDIVGILNRTIFKKRPIKRSFVYIFAELEEETIKTNRMIAASLSFGLLLFGVGLCLTLVYLLL